MGGKNEGQPSLSFEHIVPLKRISYSYSAFKKLKKLLEPVETWVAVTAVKMRGLPKIKEREKRPMFLFH